MVFRFFWGGVTILKKCGRKTMVMARCEQAAVTVLVRILVAVCCG